MKLLAIAVLSIMATMTGFSTDKVPAELDKQNVVWATPSQDAAGSMPLGNGEVVLNAWVEESTGDLLFHIARTDALSEISRFLKLGMIRVSFQPKLLIQGAFRQELRLREGAIVISGGGLKVRLFVDSEANVVHVLCSSSTSVIVRASVENWRNKAHTVEGGEMRSAWAVHDAPFELVETPDVFVKGEGVTWYHRNETSVVPRLLENQSLAGLPGCFDPILHRTFGGRMNGAGFSPHGERSLVSKQTKSIDLRIATFTAQTDTVDQWLTGLKQEEARSANAAKSEAATKAWWEEFWSRSWVFVEGDSSGGIPTNMHQLRIGAASTGSNLLPGELRRASVYTRVLSESEVQQLFQSKDGVAPIAEGRFASWTGTDLPKPNNHMEYGGKLDLDRGLTLEAWFKSDSLKDGRIFDKVTAGGSDGFLFDTNPGDGLRLIVGQTVLAAPHCLEAGRWTHVAATYDARTAEAAIYLDGKRLAHRDGMTGSAITRGYILQRFVQACQGRGEFPIKFNGGYYTVEPKAMGMPYNADFRNWGDCHWWQNVRHMYHPMLMSGDFEMMRPLFRLYEKAVPLAESRSKKYHGCEGVYFPETMTVFGTYSGGDYGWKREGLQPKDCQCPWWQYAWNQGPELVSLMLDRWDWTRDSQFLKTEALPMAEAVLRYFDTRFAKKDGKIVLDPAQAVETYWSGVVNDMPTTVGLIAVTRRLTGLPEAMTTAQQRAFFARMKVACPDLPVSEGQLQPAEKFEPKETNCENPALYAIWPYREVSLSRPHFLREATAAYEKRHNHLDVGWGYDGNCAALLGLADEAGRILQVKCANSNPAYRWPATWGPNFDWLPDQNHGGNLLETTQLMLLQCDSLEEGGAIRVLPAWPKKWDARFRLRAPGNTVVECEAKSGMIVRLVVTPGSRRKDVILPHVPIRSEGKD